MATKSAPVTAAERRKFEEVRDAATLQLLFKASRLANERGAPFDRDFWVTVAEGQAAAQDLLTATVTREPALVGLVSDMSRLYDRSSKRALAAASQKAPQAAEPGTAHEGQPAESQPTESPPDED